MAMPKGSSASWKACRTGEGCGNRPAARSGGKRGGLRPKLPTERGSAKRLRPWRRSPGERQGLRVAPLSERGFRKASAWRGSSKGGTASAQRFSEGRPERFRPRCEPLERARLRPGPIRQGSGGGMQVRPKRPDGDRREAHASLPRPTGCRTGLHRLAPGIRGRAKRTFASASQSKAAQREMASPPSDGSQSWDKWGPVATPAPIMIPGPNCERLVSAHGRLFRTKITKGTKGTARGCAQRLSFQQSRRLHRRSPLVPLVIFVRTILGLRQVCGSTEWRAFERGDFP